MTDRINLKKACKMDVNRIKNVPEKRSNQCTLKLTAEHARTTHHLYKMIYHPVSKQPSCDMLHTLLWSRTPNQSTSFIWQVHNEKNTTFKVEDWILMELYRVSWLYLLTFFFSFFSFFVI